MAAPRRVTQNRVNGLPAGIEVEYACDGCSRDFTIESPLGQLMNGASASVVGAIGVALLVYADHPGWPFGAGGLAVAGALLMLGLIAARVRARLSNPIQPDTLLD